MAREAIVRQPFLGIAVYYGKLGKATSFFLIFCTTKNSKNNLYQSLLPTDGVNAFFREPKKRFFFYNSFRDSL